MYQDELEIRVRYSETDKMGYVYYGNYAAYLEVGRVELLRKLGLSYKQMEDDGIMLPVADYHIRYLKPAYYDDLLTVRTIIKKKPVTKIEFEYEMYNQDGVLLNKAEVVLVFVDIQSGRPCRAPEDFLEKVSPYFD